MTSQTYSCCVNTIFSGIINVRVLNAQQYMQCKINKTILNLKLKPELFITTVIAGAKDSVHVSAVALIRGAHITARNATRICVHRSPDGSAGSQFGSGRWRTRVHLRHVRCADGHRAVPTARVHCHPLFLLHNVPRFQLETIEYSPHASFACLQAHLPSMGDGAAHCGALAAQLRLVPLGVSVAAARNGGRRAH